MGGERLAGGEYDKGYFVQPTVFSDVSTAMRIWKEEIFGPVLSIASCSSLDEAIDLANDTVYGLSASIYLNSVYELKNYPNFSWELIPLNLPFD